MLNSRLFATILASLLVLLQSGCTADPQGNGLNVLLVSVDTLRPDHLGCYGYARDTSPNLDAFCRESVVFRQTIAQAPSTLPSHASILTSLLPAQHGALFADRSRPLAPGMLEFIEGAYDAEIRSMDRALGKLLSLLEDLGLADSTLVVFTSDHGEEFGEHGWYGWHAHTLYDELLRVPLVVRFPDGLGAGHEISRQVRSLDIAPTVLEAVELAVPEQFGGIGLLGAIRGEPLERLFAISQKDIPTSREPVTSVRTERWKYYNGVLYDLKNDPEEQFDVSNSHWDLVKGFRTMLDETFEHAQSSTGDPVELDAETRRQLEALGYL